MLAGHVTDFVWEIAPNPAWGVENIYEMGQPDTPVTGVGVAWWLTSPMLEDMASRGLNLGLSHERIIYDVPDNYSWGQPCRTENLDVNRRIAELGRRHGLAVHRFHSNIDLAPWGMPHALLEQLGWQGYDADWSRGIPVVQCPALPLGELLGQVKAKLGLPFVRYDGDPARMVRRIAIAWGGLGQWWTGACCAAPLGFDVLISGDVIDGVVRLAREQGWAVIDAFHHATEMEGMRRLAQHVAQRFPSLRVEFLENSMPWSVA